MAIASVGSIGTNNSTTSSTTLTLTPSVTIESGNLAILVISTDNLASGTAPVGANAYLRNHVLSVTDTGSNVWHKAGENTGLKAAAGDGAVCVVYCVLTTQLTGASTITITFEAAVVSKAVTGWEYTTGGAVFPARTRFAISAGADPPSMTLDDLTSREYLFFRGIASETNSTSFTNTTNYTPLTNSSANTGAAGTSMSSNGEFRIVTATTETSDPTKTATDGSSVFIAFYETTATETPWVVSGSQLQAGVGSVTPTWPDMHEVDDIALLFIECTGGETISLTTSNGFAEVTNSPQASTDTVLGVYWCRATSTSMSDPVVADSGNHVVAKMILIRGAIATGNPWDTTNGTIENTSDTSLSIAGVTTTVSKCLIIWAATVGTDSAVAQFGSWSNTGSTRFEELEEIMATAGTGGGIGLAWGYKASAGATGSADATLVTASTKGMLSIALKPAAGGTNVTVSADTNTAASALQAPTLITNSILSSDALGVIAALQAPSVIGKANVTADTLAAVAALQAPTIVTSVVVSADALGVVASLQTPVNVTSSILSPSALGAVAALQAPTIITNSIVSAGVLSTIATLQTAQVILLPYLTNLYAWYAADSLVLSDNDAVGTWTDLSGNGRDLTQGTTDNKPIYKTGIINSLPIVRFDGSNDYLQSAGITLAHPYSLFIVYTFRSAYGSQEGVLDGVSQQEGFLGRYGQDDTFFNNDNSPGGAFQITLPNSFDTQEFHYITVIVNGASSSLRYDGGTPGTGTLKVLGLTKITLGAHGGLGQFGDVDIAEVIYYSEAIGSTDRADIEAYLDAKYFAGTDVLVTADLLTTASSLQAPTVTGKAVVSADSLAVVGALQAPTNVTSSSISADALAGVLVLQTATATSGVRVSADALGVVGALQTPTNVFSSILSISPIAGVLALPDPTVTGRAIVTGDVLSVASTLQAPTITGRAVVSADSLSGVVALTSTTVTGKAIVTADALSGVLTLQTPTVTTRTDVTVSADRLTAVVAWQSLTVSTVAHVTVLADVLTTGDTNPTLIMVDGNFALSVGGFYHIGI